MIVQEHKKGEKISCTNERKKRKRGCYNGSIKSKEAAAPQKKVQRLFLFFWADAQMQKRWRNFI